MAAVTALTAVAAVSAGSPDHATATVAAGQTLELQVTGVAGVPTDAPAVALNLSIVGAAAPGFATVFPCGAARPEASNINYAAGQTIANSVIAKPGVGGKICIYSYATADVLVDVAGFFPAGSDFTPIANPARILDTRPARFSSVTRLDALKPYFPARPIYTGNAIWLLEERGVGADYQQFLTRVDTLSYEAISQPVRATAIGSTPGAIWTSVCAAGGGSLTKFNSVTLSQNVFQSPFPIPCSASLVFDGTHIWVSGDSLSERFDYVIRVDVNTGGFEKVSAPNGFDLDRGDRFSPSSVYDGDRVWFATPSQIFGFDLRNNVWLPPIRPSIGPFFQGQSLSYQDGKLFVLSSNFPNCYLTRINLRLGHQDAVSVDANACLGGNMTYEYGRLWTGGKDENMVSIDPLTGSTQSYLVEAGKPRWIVSDGRALWSVVTGERKSPVGDGFFIETALLRFVP